MGKQTEVRIIDLVRSRLLGKTVKVSFYVHYMYMNTTYEGTVEDVQLDDCDRFQLTLSNCAIRDITKTTAERFILGVKNCDSIKIIQY